MTPVLSCLRALGVVGFASAVVASLGCGESVGPPETAVYALDRTTHFFSAPFPSDLLMKSDGTIDLPKFPEAEGLTTPIFKGYVRRFGTSVYGFGLNTGLYQQFTGPLEESQLAKLKTRAPRVTDPVLLFPLGAQSAADLVPLDARFLPSANGDPYLTDNLLLANPRATAPLRGGTTYAFVVRGDTLKTAKNGPITRDPAFDAILGERDLVRAPILKIAPLKQALAKLGIPEAKVASATVFTTQDVDAQLVAIRAKVEAALTDDHLELRRFKEVSRIAYTGGATAAHMKPAALLRVSYKDGTPDEVTEMDPETTYPQPVTLEMGSTYPYRVFEGRLRTLNLQGVADKPFGTPGLGIINDAALDTGQIRFTRTPGSGQLAVTSSPEPEEMRVVIALPLDGNRKIVSRAPVLFSDHGTGGSAYNALLGPSGEARSQELATRYAAHRALIVARDQPLFGQRHPDQIDRGFNIYLVAYNISNITAFRDNLRQSAIDNLVLWRFVRDKMNSQVKTFLTGLGGEVVDEVADPAKLFRFGHSLGSVTTHLATAFLPDIFRSSFVSGSGGIFTLFFLDSGLLPRLAGDPENLGIILQALNIDPNVMLTTKELIGGLAGIPRGPGRQQLGRDHPILTLAQTLLDPADPQTFGRRLSLPIHMVRALGDLQVPDSATDALAATLPMVTVTRCTPTASYDPHVCLFREDEGLRALSAWLDAFMPAQ